jgi:hypothetical protein
MARRLDEAPRAGGLYYTRDGTAIDANGVPLDDAPARPEDTKPEDQPYARMVAATTVGAGGAPAGATGFDARALGAAIAEGLTQAAGRASANAEATRTATDAHDEITEGAKDAKPKQGAAPIAVGSATAEAFAAPSPNAQKVPESGASDSAVVNATGGKPADSPA